MLMWRFFLAGLAVGVVSATLMSGLIINLVIYRERYSSPGPVTYLTPTPEPRDNRKRAIAVQAPKLVKRTVPAHVYLSYGPIDTTPDLPPEGRNTTRESGTIAPPNTQGGIVTPKLDVTNVEAEIKPKEVGEIAVHTPNPKRWHWEVTIPEKAEIDGQVILNPYLEYRPSKDAPPEVIWPDRDDPVALSIRVAEPSLWGQIKQVLGEVQLVSAAFGTSIAALCGLAMGRIGQRNATKSRRPKNKGRNTTPSR